MSSFRTILNKMKPVILNKYLLTLIIFAFIFLFSENRNLVKRWQTGSSIKQLEKEIAFYEKEIEKNKTKMLELQSSNEDLEKFAREQYLMKKENEDVFIVNE